MKMKWSVFLFVGVLAFFLATEATAQFSGPSVTGQTSTVAQTANARLGSYITVTGNIVAHERGDYFTFQDGTGTIRVEIANDVWQGRNIGPQTRVRLLGEVDQGLAGRYLWIKSLQVVE